VTARALLRLVAAVVLVLAGSSSSRAEPARAAPTPPRAESSPPVFGLAIHVATKDGAPVRDDAWIADQIAEAVSLYLPLGVAFRWTTRDEIPPAQAAMHTRADRDALAPFATRAFIDVFVVGELEDVDEPGRYRKGVAWTSKPDGRRYLILSGVAPPKVLAHELGHFFGNGHSDVPDNLMSYTRAGGEVFLDEAQIERTRAFARRFHETGRLLDVGPPRLLP